MIDGASVLRQFWQIIMPLMPPALAALATLEFTWMYNDFFWAVVLLNTGRGPADHLVARQPRRAVLHGRQPDRGGVDVRRVPTLVVYLALQRYFITGLTLGADKG